MDPHDEINAIELQDCPLCGGPGLLEEEGGFAQGIDLIWSDAARRAARTWNLGKVIYPGPGD